MAVRLGSTMHDFAFRSDPRAREKVGRATQEFGPPAADVLAGTLSQVAAGPWAADVRVLPEGAVRSFFDAPPPGHFDNYGASPALRGAIDVLVFLPVVSPSTPPDRNPC